MEKYICTVCDYVYDPELGDPENGIEPGTSFEDLPEDWVCPLCGVGKEEFEKAKNLSHPHLKQAVHSLAWLCPPECQTIHA